MLDIEYAITRVSAAAILTLALTFSVAAQDLPSWNDGEAKESIIEFVAAVTTEGGPEYVEPAERLAVFDNDGTLWSEQPMYVQFAFALDRVKAMAKDHPEWNETEPFKSVLAGDKADIAASGKKGLAEIIASTHAGMTSEQFTQIVADWIGSATHPTTDKAYTAMIYHPMLELIDYLKANEFDVYIVSGGGIEFMRPWTEKTYGIPPQNVVGSSIKIKFEMNDGVPVLNRQAEVNFVDDGPGKPVGIQTHIGRKPIAAFGNSDGDIEMLQWVNSGPGRRFAAILHHDDDDREVAYDRDSHFGKLDRGLDIAADENWTLISMKNDWKQVFPE